MADEPNKPLQGIALERRTPAHPSAEHLRFRSDGLGQPEVHVRDDLDENFLNGLGAQRIPDLTTARDFTWRFRSEDILTLQEGINRWDLSTAKVVKDSPGANSGSLRLGCPILSGHTPITSKTQTRTDSAMRRATLGPLRFRPGQT